MKQLRDLLSKSRSAAISEEISATSPGTAEPEPEAVTDCGVCGGAGFVRRERPLDDPMFGRAEPCDCVLQEAEDVRRERLQRIGNLAPMRRYTFTGFDPGGAETPALRSALNAAQDFAADPQGWLVLSGPSGSGKTHLAAAIANARVDAGEPALFLTVADLLDHLRAGYDAEDDELGYEQVFEQVRIAPLLILDDIDAVSPTPWAREKLFQLLNSRYNETLPTVFTTSLRVDQLDDRFATRLGDPRLSHVVALQGARHAGYRQVGGMTLDRLGGFQFRNFEVRIPGLAPDEQASLDGAYRAAQDFADNPSGWLVFMGPNGCGKTHLAGAIANRALIHGRDVVFAVVPDLLDHLRRSYAPGREDTRDDLFDRVRDCALLVLDDLGAQVSSPWAQEKLYQVVNYRTVAGLPTVVTTDQPFDELRAAHPRIVARVADPRAGMIVTILAPHYGLGRMAESRHRGRHR